MNVNLSKSSVYYRGTCWTLQEEREKKTVEVEKRERPEIEAAEKPVKEKPKPVPEEPEDAEKYKKMPKVEAEVTEEESKLAIGKAKVNLTCLILSLFIINPPCVGERGVL